MTLTLWSNINLSTANSYNLEHKFLTELIFAIVCLTNKQPENGNNPDEETGNLREKKFGKALALVPVQTTSYRCLNVKHSLITKDLISARTTITGTNTLRLTRQM